MGVSHKHDRAWPRRAVWFLRFVPAIPREAIAAFLPEAVMEKCVVFSHATQVCTLLSCMSSSLMHVLFSHACPLLPCMSSSPMHVFFSHACSRHLPRQGSSNPTISLLESHYLLFQHQLDSTGTECAFFIASINVMEYACANMPSMFEAYTHTSTCRVPGRLVDH